MLTTQFAKPRQRGSQCLSLENVVWNWLRKKTVQQIAKEQLDEAQLHLLEAEANLERASSERQMYRERVDRLTLSANTNVTVLRREREG